MESGLSMRRLGDAIRQRREALRWTQYELAKRARVSDQYVRTIEAGTGKRVGVEVLAAIAAALGEGVDELLADAGIQNPATFDDDDGPSLDVYLRTSQGLSPDDVQQVIRVIQALKAEDELERLKRELRQRQTVADDAQAVTEEEQEDIAAYDRPDLAAEMRRQALGWTEEDGTDAEPD